jgi:hypothetical protein
LNVIPKHSIQVNDNENISTDEWQLSLCLLAKHLFEIKFSKQYHAFGSTQVLAILFFNFRFRNELLVNPKTYYIQKKWPMIFIIDH